MSTLLEVKDITKIYPNQPKPGLDHVSFEVMQGEFLGIMGASGSGKSRTARDKEVTSRYVDRIKCFHPFSNADLSPKSGKKSDLKGKYSKSA